MANFNMTLKIDDNNIYCIDVEGWKYTTDSEGYKVYSVDGAKTTYNFKKRDNTEWKDTDKAEYIATNGLVTTGRHISSWSSKKSLEVWLDTYNNENVGGVMTQDFYIRVPYIPTNKKINIVMTGCSCDLLTNENFIENKRGFDYYSLNEDVTSLTFKVNEGYIFRDNAGTAYNKDSGSFEYLALDSDNTTFTLENIDNYSDIRITAVKDEPPKKEVHTKLVNCQCDLLNDSTLVENGEPLDTYSINADVTSLTFTANEGYIFKDKIGTVYNKKSGRYEEITISEASPTYTLDNLDNFSSDIRLTAVLNEKPSELKKVNIFAKGCSCDLLTDDNLVETNGSYKIYEIDKNITSLTFKVLEGYLFTTGYIGKGLLIETGSFKGFTIENGDYTQYTVTDIDKYRTIELTGTYSTLQTKSAFTNIYKVNAEILDKLAKARYIKLTDATGNNITDDLGKYIMSLYKIYLPITDDYIEAEEQLISLGFFNTNIYSPVVKQETIKFNLGRITVNEEYNNVYDYKDTTALIYLPFTSDIIELDLSYIINQTLTFEYEVNLYNGKCNILISSTFTDDIIEVVSCDIVDNIPYILANDETVSSDKTNINKSFPEIRIDVVRQIPYNSNKEDVFGKECDRVCLLSDIKGYVEVENILFSSKEATTTEKQEIKALLLEGVYINDEVVK